MNPRLGIMCAHFENVDFLNCREGLPSTVWGADGPIYMAVLYGSVSEFGPEFDQKQKVSESVGLVGKMFVHSVRVICAP